MLLTVFTFLIIISVLVFVHELGHFLVARWLGVGVEEFGFGLPPKAFGKKIRGTIYSVNWLPIGGFVKLAGEDDGDEKPRPKTQYPKSAYFWARSKKERAAILLAGVTMNFLLAVVITTFLLTRGVYEPSGRVHIEQVLAGSPAQAAGLKQNDVISSIKYAGLNRRVEEKLLTTSQELIETTKTHLGETVTLVIVRAGKELTAAVVPRKQSPANEGPMGVVISDLELKTYVFWQAPGKAVQINLSRAAQMLSSIGQTLWRFITLKPVQEEVAGPIGIAQITGQALRYGVIAVLEFASVLSLNLAVLNILPIPALDGGRLVFVFLEKLFGRRVRPAFEKSTHQIGMIILFALIILISINDILRLARGS